MNCGEPLHLVGDLRRHQEDVAVVLLELPHAREPRQRAAHLVAVQHVVGGVADRQLAVGMLVRTVHQVVRRAVHRLERAVVLPGLVVEHEEHVLLVLAPVPGDLPEPLVVEQRRLDLLVPVALQLPHELVQQVVERRAAVGPERRARRERMEHEEVELLAQRGGGRASAPPPAGGGGPRARPS